jgi:hypothetical protein
MPHSPRAHSPTSSFGGSEMGTPPSRCGCGSWGVHVGCCGVAATRGACLVQQPLAHHSPLASCTRALALHHYHLRHAGPSWGCPATATASASGRSSSACAQPGR